MRCLHPVRAALLLPAGMLWSRYKIVFFSLQMHLKMNTTMIHGQFSFSCAFLFLSCFLHHTVLLFTICCIVMGSARRQLCAQFERPLERGVFRALLRHRTVPGLLGRRRGDPGVVHAHPDAQQAPAGARRLYLWVRFFLFFVRFFRYFYSIQNDLGPSKCSFSCLIS